MHACSYLPGRWARTVVADPSFPADAALYARLADVGFRRSGDHIYRPMCPECEACVPVRLRAAGFKPRRSQRRIARTNRDLVCTFGPARFEIEHFALYSRYQGARHAEGEMALHDEDDYRGFLLSSWSNTELLEMRDTEGSLLAVAVVDVLEQGLSAVYTFFAPEASRRGPGVQALLVIIEEARRRELEWVYLGYWIAGCDKMSYKDQYRPQQHLIEGQWTDV